MTDIMTNEDMRKELEAAGYAGEWLLFGTYQEFSFTFGDGIEIHDSDKDKATEYAYTHLQHEKKYAAMEALLEKLISYETPDELEAYEDVDVTTHLWNWFYDEIEPEAKKILGKE